MPPRLKGRLRRGRLTAASRVARLLGDDAAVPPCVQFLCTHRIGSVDAFRRFVDGLSQTYCLVDFTTAVDRVRYGPIDTPMLALSFDDGYLDQAAAGRVLESFRVRGCFYVCSDALDGVAPDRWCRQRLNTTPAALMTWDDAAALAAAGHEIGGHSATHANLARCTPAALADEIGRSTDRLRARLGDVRHFAWPWGVFERFSAAGREAVCRSGYATYASAEKGCHRAAAGGDGLLYLPRTVADAPFHAGGVGYQLRRDAASPGATATTIAAAVG